MKQRDLSHLMDILQAAKQARAFIEGVDKETFDESSLIQSAVMRQIEIMGEATKRISDGIRSEYTQVPWRQIAGMRDILIHAYDHVDRDEVWNAVVVSIPSLIEQIEAIVQELQAKPANDVEQ